MNGSAVTPLDGTGGSAAEQFELTASKLFPHLFNPNPPEIPGLMGTKRAMADGRDRMWKLWQAAEAYAAQTRAKHDGPRELLMDQIRRLNEECAQLRRDCIAVNQTRAGLEQENTSLREQNRKWVKAAALIRNSEKWKSEKYALERENARLLEFLRDYGSHHDDCCFMRPGELGKTPCDCGWAAALSEAKTPPQEEKKTMIDDLDERDYCLVCGIEIPPGPDFCSPECEQRHKEPPKSDAEKGGG